MKCPHCDYTAYSRDENNKLVIHSEGNFYYLPIEVERGSGWDKDRRKVVGCPKCHKIFMKEW